MKEFLVRVSSRKFLIAAAAVLGFLANRQYPEALAAAVAYIGAEGLIDAKSTTVNHVIHTAAAEDGEYFDMGSPSEIEVPEDDDEEPASQTPVGFSAPSR